MGVETMEGLVVESGIEELFRGETIEDMVRRGFLRAKVEVENGRANFPGIPQVLCPCKRK